MAFEVATANGKNKNQFVARLVSKKTGKTVTWVNLTEEFARSVFACTVAEITAQMALETLPKVLTNDYVEVAVTDLTAEMPTVDATEF